MSRCTKLDTDPTAIFGQLLLNTFFSERPDFFGFLRYDWNNFGSYGKVTLRAFQNIKNIEKILSHRWEIFNGVQDFANKRISKELQRDLYSNTDRISCLHSDLAPFWRSPRLNRRFLIDDKSFFRFCWCSEKPWPAPFRRIQNYSNRISKSEKLPEKRKIKFFFRSGI